ncbi:MAG: PEGA domain-containing protein [Deltaproteobacteria bacterium]|jgi:hypothetical protein|nr:PEGA domain-containing protein [Deltaproteobacteria bacterium]MBW2531863.1 PEGA domain-containing protein [Deltaproteobacteria bacterium]
MRRCLLCAAAVVLGLWAGTLAAKPSTDQIAAARALAYAGYEMLQNEQWAEAYDRFQQAEKIFHAPPHVLYMARAKRGLGEYVAARALYQSLIDEEFEEGSPKEFAKAKEDAASELEGILPKIATIQLSVTGPTLEQASVEVDGRDVTEEAREGTVDADPGERTVRVTAAGYEAAETTVTLEEGAQAVPVALTLELLPEPVATGTGPVGPPPDQAEGSLIPGFVVMGVGVAAVGVGIATGVVAMGKADELKTNCPVRNQCPPDNESLEDDARLFGTVSTVGLVVGGAALAGGTVLLLLRPFGGGGDEPADSAADTATVEPIVGPGTFGIRGTF